MAQDWSDSEAPESLVWIIDIVCNRRELIGGEVEQYASCLRMGAKGLTYMVLGWRKAFGGFHPVNFEFREGHLYIVEGKDSRGRPCILRAKVAPQSPFPFRSLVLFRSPPSQYSYRPALRTDYAACADIERRSPTVSAQGTYTIARGVNFSNYFDLQGQSFLSVVEYAGEIVGWGAASLRPMHSPKPHVLYYAAQAYMLPQHQDSGALSAARVLLMEWFQEHADVAFFYMNIDNPRAQNFSEGANLWSLPICDAAISCAGRTAQSTGRPATPSDAHRLLALFNAAHRNEALYDPYDENSLLERFSRVPDAYGWHRVVLGEDAAVGLWLAAEEITHSVDGKTRHSKVAHVLDYGYDGERGLKELKGLLEAATVIAREAGMTHVSILTSKPSPAYPTIVSMADDITEYVMAHRDVEPSDLNIRGLYADHIYF